jgi:hypothetical protein
MSRDPSPQEAGRKALQQIDDVLRRKPEKDDYALTEATQYLCIYRDGLIEAARGAGAVERERLARANAVLSIVAATHFPVGPVPWDPLDSARGSLADLLGADASGPAE